ACFVVALLGSGAALADGHGGHKVTVCHKGRTISVARPAVKGHRRHGDTVGPCPSCSCPTTPDPVTCHYGKAFDNLCLAECAGESADQCSGCACPSIVDPVVCEEGKIFANQCLANCSASSRHEDDGDDDDDDDQGDNEQDHWGGGDVGHQCRPLCACS